MTDKEFATLVKNAADRVGARGVADKLSVSHLAVKRWIQGGNLPRPAMRKHIEDAVRVLCTDGE